nr:hypothetical protein [Tanacetum cinerariifolium]
MCRQPLLPSLSLSPAKLMIMALVDKACPLNATDHATNYITDVSSSRLPNISNPPAISSEGSGLMSALNRLPNIFNPPAISSEGSGLMSALNGSLNLPGLRFQWEWRRTLRPNDINLYKSDLALSIAYALSDLAERLHVFMQLEMKEGDEIDAMLHQTGELLDLSGSSINDSGIGMICNYLYLNYPNLSELNLNSCKALLPDVVVQAVQTKLEMEEGDEIDAMLHQTGDVVVQAVQTKVN